MMKGLTNLAFLFAGIVIGNEEVRNVTIKAIKKSGNAIDERVSKMVSDVLDVKPQSGEVDTKPQSREVDKKGSL